MKISRPRFQRLLQAVKTHPKRTALIAILIIALIGIAVYALITGKDDEPRRTERRAEPAKVIPHYAPLTGVEVSDETVLSKPVTAIMIENSPDARPQSGLKDAEVVYEAIAEGGITRFIAIYQQNKPELIGPVRSVRPYYIDFATPYDTSFAHSGGSARATQQINSGSYRNIGQPTNGGSYYRATDRFAPHNVYTSSERLDALNASKGYQSSAPKGFQRDDKPTSSETPATTINVGISSPTFNSSYTYDSATKTYARAQGGAPHIDREKGQITSSVVVVMNVNETKEFQDTTREVIQTTGSGSVTIFQNGSVITGTWSRANTTDQFTFSDAEGKPISLARGQTWVTAIPNGSGSVSWQ